MLMRWPVASGPSPVARRTGRSGQAYQHASVETFTALSRGIGVASVEALKHQAPPRGATRKTAMPRCMHGMHGMQAGTW